MKVVQAEENWVSGGCILIGGEGRDGVGEERYESERIVGIYPASTQMLLRIVQQISRLSILSLLVRTQTDTNNPVSSN